VSNTGRSTVIDEVLAAVDAPVRLLFYEEAVGCEACRRTRSVLDQLARRSHRIVVEALSMRAQPDRAALHGIDRVPAVVVASGGRDRIRFYGAPDGHELQSLVEAIRLTASGDSRLSAASRVRLARLTRNVRLQVFFTPSCVYCPQMVTLANQLAVESPLISSAAIDATEYPDLVERYRVNGVPKTIVNDTLEIMGAVSEADLVSAVLDAPGVG
jgi:glutaredoxin-like protein